MKLVRIIVVVAGLVLVLGAVNLSIRDKEGVLADGRLVLFQLRPVDPRSLMQGDYMILRYADLSGPRQGNRREHARARHGHPQAR